jgi:hypothetical protein
MLLLLLLLLLDEEDRLDLWSPLSCLVLAGVLSAELLLLEPDFHLVPLLGGKLAASPAA